jgi:phosphate:Na+ symporter
MEQFELLAFISGIGIFLFGIDQLEQALKSLSSRSLKLMLRKHTHNPLKAIVSGTVSTAILQSSSVVGLMVLAFVGAGILDMRNALGIILGSNLGTTFTGWIVATLGFKFNLASFYLPLVGFGCLGLVVFGQDRASVSNKPRYLSQLLLGLGLLLMGLVLMKESIEAFSNSFDVSVFSEYGIFVFFSVGVIFTAIIQSSSATMMITLSALNANVIGLESAAALVIGADLGTTGTVVLGAVKGSPVKRQVAGAHFLFNLVTDLTALLCLPWLIKIVANLYALEDPLLALVAFHSTFNVIGICLFLPFLSHFARLLERIFKEDTSVISRYIRTVPAGELEESVMALEAETKHLFHRVFQLNLRCFDVSTDAMKKIAAVGAFSDNRPEKSSVGPYFSEGYEGVKQLEGEIIEFAYLVLKEGIDVTLSARIEQLLETVRDTAYAAKEIKDIRQDLEYIRQSENVFLYQINEQLTSQAAQFYMEASDLFNPHNEAILLENYSDLKNGVKQNADAVTNRIYQQSSDKKLSEQDISTLLNMTGELSLSNVLLLRAIQSYLFKTESSRNIAQLV